MLLYFTIIYVLELISSCCFCLVRIYDRAALHISNPPSCYILKLAMVEFTPWKSADSTNHPLCLSPESLLLNIYQHITELRKKPTKTYKRSLWRKLLKLTY